MNRVVRVSVATSLAKRITLGACVLTLAACSGGSTSSPTLPAPVTTATAQPPTTTPPVVSVTTAPTSFAVAAGRIAFGVKSADGNSQIWSAEKLHLRQ